MAAVAFWGREKLELDLINFIFNIGILSLKKLIRKLLHHLRTNIFKRHVIQGVASKLRDHPQ